MPPKPTIAIDSPTLLAVLGKELDDPIVQSVLNKSGKTKVQKPGRDGFYAFAKEAGYTLQFRPIPRAPKGTAMVVDIIILHSEGEDGNRGDYSTYRVLDLRIRSHEQTWDARRRAADQAVAVAKATKRA